MLGNTVASLFWRNAIQFADQPAFLVCRPDQPLRSLVWGELGSLAAAWVETLQAHPALRWDRGGQSVRVASHLQNSLEWILLDVSLQTLGAVHVAIDPREPKLVARELCEFSQADLFITPDDLSQFSFAQNRLDARACSHLAEGVSAQQPAQILFTSGSMGKPKGVVLSHRNLLSNAQAKLAAAPQNAHDLRLNILPFAHAYARTCELTAWIVSRSQLALSTNWSDLERQADILRPSLINLVPYLAKRLAEGFEREPNAFGGRLRLLQVGGAALPDELWRQLQQHGLPPLQGYGLTEAAPVVCSNRAGQQRPGVVGPPVSGVEVRIDSKQELWCRGPNVMLGYLNDPETTEKVLTAGWLRTGDLARTDDRGDITICGRVSHQIVLSTGYKVAPEEIERELQTDPWIDHVMICGQGQPCVVALIWVSPDVPAALPVNTSTARLPAKWQSEWLQRIRRCLSRYPRYAQPENFFLSADRLCAGDGLLSKKGTLCRSQISDRYQAQLEQLFGNAS